MLNITHLGSVRGRVSHSLEAQVCGWPLGMTKGHCSSRSIRGSRAAARRGVLGEHVWNCGLWRKSCNRRPDKLPLHPESWLEAGQDPTRLTEGTAPCEDPEWKLLGRRRQKLSAKVCVDFSSHSSPARWMFALFAEKETVSGRFSSMPKGQHWSVSELGFESRST